MIECRKMMGPERLDAFALLRRRYTDEAALGDALALLLDRPDYGFLWLAYDDDLPVGCVTVGFAVGAAAGGLVAELRDVVLAPGHADAAGRAMIDTLAAHVRALGVARLEATLDAADTRSARLFAEAGFTVAPGTRVSRDR